MIACGRDAPERRRACSWPSPPQCVLAARSCARGAGAEARARQTVCDREKTYDWPEKAKGSLGSAIRPFPSSAGRLRGPSPACWMRRSAPIEPSKPPGRSIRILGVVGCPSALEWKCRSTPLPEWPHEPPDGPADTRLAKGEQPSPKERLHRFKKCVSIWDAQGLKKKQ